MEIFDKLARSCGQLFETETLAPLAILITTKFEDCWHEGNLQLVGYHTKVDIDDVNLYFPIAQGIILDQEAYRFMNKFRSKAPSSMQMQIAEVTEPAYEIWMILPTAFNVDFRLEYPKRIVASCIHIAMTQYCLHSSVEQACEIVECSPLKGLGDSIDIAVENAVLEKQQAMDMEDREEDGSF